MKNFKISAVLFLVLAAISCKKEESTTITENPMKATIAAKTVVDSFYTYQYSDFEAGFRFYPSRDGKINKLGCQMRSKGNYLVSLWDFTTEALIASTTVNVTDTTSFFYNTISDVPIVANKNYVVSILIPSGNYYNVYFKKPTVAGASIYPFTKGNITIVDRRDALDNPTPSFPTNVDFQWSIIGVPDIQFEYTE